MRLSYRSNPIRHRAALLLAAVALVACTPSQPPVLSNVRIAPADLSPAAPDNHNHFSLWYTLGQPASISATIQGPDGTQWQVLDDATRPTRGDYRIALDGTVPGPGPNEQRVLADGDYTVTVDAVAGGVQQQASVTMPIRNADTQIPEIQNLSLYPDTISPNGQAIADVTHVTYRLTKDASVSTFAERVEPDGQRTHVWDGERIDTPAGEQALTWDGHNGTQPLPDGNYEFGVRAQDADGNISEARANVTISGGGTPSATIVTATIGPTQIIRGNQICLDVVVRNTGDTTIRTEGPGPDYVYNSFDTYSSIAEHQYSEQAGLWRVGLDSAAAPDTTGARFPYRWGFGQDLQPGESASVRGCVNVENPQSKLVYFGALIQENVAIHDDGVGLVPVSITP